MNFSGTRLALPSTSDTDLLSARASGADWLWGNPTRGIPDLADAALVVVRLLGSPHDLDPWREEFLAEGRPVVVLGDETQPNAELMELSTVPIGVAAEAHRDLAEGGPANLTQLHAFLSDTVLLTGEGFEPPAAEDMRAAYRRIKVAAKNVDTREHDIADSDDYFQHHGGMVATVRALTGGSGRAYVGDSNSPDAVRTRTLQEETNRVFRARVVNPRWISAMQRHGYKGAFELAATVDYLFGFDATAGVVHDWMYESLARSYVLDPENREFMTRANPWALRGIVERLHEAADRGLWQAPSPDTLAAMQEVYLELEGDLEDRG